MSALDEVIQNTLAQRGWDRVGLSKIRDASAELASLRALLAEARDKEEYKGHCFRHGCYFKPISPFNNNCPACYWEGKHAAVLAKLEALK